MLLEWETTERLREVADHFGKPQAKNSSGSGANWYIGTQAVEGSGIGPPAVLNSRTMFDGTVTATDMDRATDAREKGRIGIFGTGNAYAGSSGRVTSERIGRDLNPNGRGDGNAYVGGDQNYGRIAPILPASNARRGNGNSVNNFITDNQGRYDATCDSSVWDSYERGLWITGKTHTEYCMGKVQTIQEAFNLCLSSAMIGGENYSKKDYVTNCNSAEAKLPALIAKQKEVEKKWDECVELSDELDKCKRKIEPTIKACKKKYRDDIDKCNNISEPNAYRICYAVAQFNKAMCISLAQMMCYDLKQRSDTCDSEHLDLISEENTLQFEFDIPMGSAEMQLSDLETAISQCHANATTAINKAITNGCVIETSETEPPERQTGDIKPDPSFPFGIPGIIEPLPAAPRGSIEFYSIDCCN